MSTIKSSRKTAKYTKLQLITKLKKGMKEPLISVFDRIMLRKRSVIKSVVDQLKNISLYLHHQSSNECSPLLLS
jgi:hypothetical protein